MIILIIISIIMCILFTAIPIYLIILLVRKYKEGKYSINFKRNNFNYQYNKTENREKNLGDIGENETIRHLKNNDEKYILNNIYIPKNEKSSTEIDVLCINEKGIFVYESKNLSGWIFGNEKDNQWTQVLKGGKKSQFYNPIKQNENHIKHLKKFLNEPDLKIYSIVIFSNRSEFKKVVAEQENYNLLKYHQLPSFIQCYKNNEKFQTCINEEKVSELYTKLSKMNTPQFNNTSL